MVNNAIINANITIIEAIEAINKLINKAMTLFVVDDKSQLVGTLTDGDIRRGLIAGFQLSDKVCNVMFTNFRSLFSDECDIEHIVDFRENNVTLIPIVDRDYHIIDIIDLYSYKSALPIDAVLMAGGKGERLRPLTEKTPKPLLKIGGKAIIDYNIDRLIDYGVKNINVTVNYLKDQLQNHFSKERKGIIVNCCEEPRFLGTIGAIKFVKEFKNDTILIMNSDLFTNIDYESFLLHFREHNADMSVAAVPYNVSIPYGVLDLEGRVIKGLIEKPKYNYYANAGIYLIKRSVLKYIPDEVFYNATDLIEKLISIGKKVIRYPLNGTWIDIGTPQEYQRAQELVKHI